jgi:hypothetical protein
MAQEKFEAETISLSPLKQYINKMESGADCSEHQAMQVDY